MGDKWSELFGSEWDWVKKLGACFSDPEEKKAFWETVKDKKLADPAYSVYTDFPREQNATKRAMNECFEFVKGLRRIEGRDSEGELHS